jgi:Protein of unknown function (DUF4239)
MLLSLLVVAVVTSVSVALLWGMRRFSPDDGYLVDHSSGPAIIGVLGTLVAVILAFVILLALQSYRAARDSASQEAVAVTQLYGTTALLPDPLGGKLRGELVCYSRTVVNNEWRTMRRGDPSPAVQTWLDQMSTDIVGLKPSDAQQTIAEGQWFTQDTARREGRRGRLAAATPLVPSLLWFVLLLGSVLLIACLLLFADHRERFTVQAILIGGVCALLASGLTIVGFLDTPYGGGAGRIHPVEMERTLALIAQTTSPAISPGQIPCEIRGSR